MAIGTYYSTTSDASTLVRGLWMDLPRQWEDEQASYRAGEPQPFGREVSTEPKPEKDRVKSVLSPRETEVLRLVAEGLTSKQIGKELFLSPKTVNYHLSWVFNKLGVDSRAHAVAVAARQGLL